MIKRYSLLFCAFFVFLFLSCGGYNSNESGGKGNITFKIGWQGAPTTASQKNGGSSSLNRNAVSIDCTSAGVSTVQAAVYDVSNNSLASGGPWDCSAHSGAITNVQAGTNRKVVFLGKDSSSNIQYRGETTGITVEEGKTSDAGTITMKPSIAGTWGAVKLTHQQRCTTGGYWITELDKVTLNDDGTGTVSSTYKDGNVTSKSASSSFTYSTIPYSDGSQILTLIGKDGVSAYKAIISDDKNVMIFDGTFGDQSIWIWIKMDASKTYTNADFIGDYYGMLYSHTGATSPTSHRVGATTTLTSNGSGGISEISSTENANGTISTATSSSSYSINSDGSGVLGTNPSCTTSYFSSDGKLALWSDACSSGTTWGGGILMKKGDKTYSTSDLSGTWAVVSLGDYSGTDFWAGIGTITCNSSGSCSTSGKTQTNGTITYQSSTNTLSVASDGRITGTDLSEFNVIGNNGNMIIWVDAFVSSNPNMRNIGIAVKCSACSNLAGQ